MNKLTLRQYLKSCDYNKVYIYIYDEYLKWDKDETLSTVASKFDPFVKELLAIPESSVPNGFTIMVLKNHPEQMFNCMVKLKNYNFKKEIPDGLMPYMGSFNDESAPDGFYNILWSGYYEYLSIDSLEIAMDSFVESDILLDPDILVAEVLYSLTDYGYTVQEFNDFWSERTFENFALQET